MYCTLQATAATFPIMAGRWGADAMPHVMTDLDMQCGDLRRKLIVA